MQPVSHATVQDFYRAYMTRDPARVAPFLDDDVDWMISGPVDVMPFCGHRRGRAAVLKLVDRRAPTTLDGLAFEPEMLLVDGDRAAMLCTLSAVIATRKRKVSYRVAHFLRFRDGKLIKFRAIMDSFDAAEQILGHAIDVTQKDTLRARAAAVGDLIAT
jgi:ketosteroid isomerase-like protein